ncbi:MAG: efflux RND transporter periplasmic adaptor subunit, partial [Planctomycetota bacterium]
MTHSGDGETEVDLDTSTVGEEAWSPAAEQVEEAETIRRSGRRLLPMALGLLAVVGAGLLAVALVRSRPAPAQQPVREQLPLVRSVPVQPTSTRLDVHARGAVRPRTTTDLAAQVAGPVIWLADDLLDGARVADGAALVRIDDADRRSAVAQAAATVAARQQRLIEERARAERQIREWAAVESEAAAPELVRRVPHIAAAEAELAAAQAALEQAQRNLERCTIRAPFAARVVERRTERGQWLNPGQTVAVLQAEDVVEVVLPLELSAVRRLDLPLDGSLLSDGPPVELQGLGDAAGLTWQGRVVRSAARLDARNRLLDVVVRVPRRAADPPLLVGQFVAARIHGPSREAVAWLDPQAVEGGERIWLCEPMDAADREAFRPPPPAE